MGTVAFQGWYNFSITITDTGQSLTNGDLKLAADGSPETGLLHDSDGDLDFEGDRTFPGGTGEILYDSIGGGTSTAGEFYGTLVPTDPTVASDITLFVVETGSFGPVTFFSAFIVSDRPLTQAEMEGARPTTPFQFSLYAIAGEQTVTLPCFLTGTHIATPTGERTVECLAPGDLVLTRDGRAVPVRWVGQRKVAAIFARRTQDRVVRIAAGALEQGMPRRDLYVTADHALFRDGYLVNAGTLLNGHSIAYGLPRGTGASYILWHIETANHEILLAEGTPAESFIDYVSRDSFDNAETAVPRIIAEAPWPRISSARHLPDSLRPKTVA